MKYLRMITRMRLKLDRTVTTKHVKRNMYDTDNISLKLFDLKYGFLVYIIGISIGIIGFLAEQFIYQIIIKHKRIIFFHKIFIKKSKI